MIDSVSDSNDDDYDYIGEGNIELTFLEGDDHTDPENHIN